MYARNLYVLAGSLGFFAVVSFVLAFTGVMQESGAPSQASLWRTIGILLVIGALIASLLGVLQQMFEQAERRDVERRQAERERRRRG
ncbi:MAG: hypothetical protein JSS87_10675 [Acidobacteria bacterium]|nr:hypothetical protein [Acidobacteriota bacterium]